MISKKLSLSALLIFSTVANISAQVSDNSIAEAYKGKNGDWKYVEYIFLEKPKADLKKFAQKTRASLIALAALTILSTKVDSIKNMTFDGSAIKFDFQTYSAGALGLISYEYIISYMDASIKHEALVSFLKNWSLHKENVPTSLIPVFDELSELFNASKDKTFSSEDVNAIFEVIQHLIEHEFSNRYESKDKKKDADMLGMFKTITDIGKNLAPSSK